MKLGLYEDRASPDSGIMPQYKETTPPGAFGEGVGDTLNKAAAEVVDPLVQQQNQTRERIIQTQLNDSESKLHAAYLNAMNGPDGLKKKTGSDARAAAPDTRKIITDAFAQINKGEMLPHARDLFVMRSKTMMGAYENSINEYMNEQDKVGLAASTKTAMALGTAIISGGYKDDDLVAKTTAQVESKLSAYSRSQDGGASEGQHVQEWNKTVGLTVIRNNLKENTESGIATARKKLVQYTPFLGDQLHSVEGEINVAEEKIGGLTAAIKAAANNTNDNSTLVNEIDARSDILDNDKLTPTAKMFAMTHLQTLATEGAKAQDQANRGSFSRIYSAYRKGGFGTIPPEDVSYLRDQPEHQGVDQWQKFLNIVREDGLHKENQPETEEQRRAYGAFLADFAAHKDKFAAMPIESFQSDYHASFNPRRRVEADTLVSSLKTPVPQTEGLTHDEMRLVLQYGRSNGYFKETDPTLWSPEDELRMETITRGIEGQRTSWMQGHPKQKPGPDEVQKWVHQMYDPNVVLKSGFFRDTRINAIDAAINPAPYRGKTIIPAAQLKQIDEALDTVRLSHDDVNREWMYRKYQEKNSVPEALKAPPPDDDNLGVIPMPPPPGRP